MRRCLSAFLILFGVLSDSGAHASGPAVVAALAEAQEASHRGDMAAADSLSRSIIRRWPEDPTGYYARAALVQIRTFGCPGTRSDDGVRENLDSAVAVGVRYLAGNPEDTWARYILGLALGLRAVLAVRDGAIWTAYRTALESVDEFEDVLRRDSTFADAWLPLGTYHYWRGDALKRWTWLPFINDTRARGIEEIRRAAMHGRTARISAQSMLLWAQLANKNYEETLRTVGPLLEMFPANRSFRWARAEAYMGLGRWPDAERAFASVLETFGPEHEGCPGPVEIRARRGMALVEMGSCERAKPLLEAALAYPLPAAARRFDEVKAQARRYLERCASEHGSGR